VRNSSLVQGFCAENVPGLKHTTEALECHKDMVGEHCIGVEAYREVRWSLYKRECQYEYTKRQVRILSAENLRFPGEGSSAQGKSGPKPRPKGVGDGQSVEIPIPPLNRIE
jgi:hypothetical protein